MDFYINKGATLPTLKMELIEDGRNDYKNFHTKIQNANIYFTMYDIVNGVKKIAKQPADVVLRTKGCEDEPDVYYITYNWRAQDTNKVGTFKGEFKIDFLDGTGTLIAPIREELIIHVLGGSIKK
jgi:hypothetical protein